MKELELRMYFLVPYNISPIQQAIQAGHAALEYSLKFRDDFQFNSFVRNHKTWIILNGGTTNSARDFDMLSQGTLNQATDRLTDNDIQYSAFHEPDLNDALTAVCFIADERVFNYVDYPEFKEYLIDQYGFQRIKDELKTIKKTGSTLKDDFNISYNTWVKDVMGGEKNVFLRELLKGKKLA